MKPPSWIDALFGIGMIGVGIFGLIAFLTDWIE
jgi:hypothetical protein